MESMRLTKYAMWKRVSGNYKVHPSYFPEAVQPQWYHVRWKYDLGSGDPLDIDTKDEKRMYCPPTSDDEKGLTNNAFSAPQQGQQDIARCPTFIESSTELTDSNTIYTFDFHRLRPEHRSAKPSYRIAFVFAVLLQAGSWSIIERYRSPFSQISRNVYNLTDKPRPVQTRLGQLYPSVGPHKSSIKG